MMLVQTMFDVPKIFPSNRNAATSDARVVIPATKMEKKISLVKWIW
jgi:hypothetical protein